MAKKILDVVHCFPNEPIFLKKSLMDKQEHLRNLAMVLDAEGSTKEDNEEIQGTYSLHLCLIDLGFRCMSIWRLRLGMPKGSLKTLNNGVPCLISTFEIPGFKK